MSDINLFTPILKKLEGGFSNVTNDVGGVTMAGITMNTYIYYCDVKRRKMPSVDDLKNISDVDWTDIVKTLYWDKIQADNILNQSLANLLCDFTFNSGVWCVKILQRILGLTPDGIVGAKTIQAVNTANQKELFDNLKNERIDFVNDIVNRNPSQKVFLKGWINRINLFIYSD
jgi:lysozyme family protein